MYKSGLKFQAEPGLLQFRAEANLMQFCALQRPDIEEKNNLHAPVQLHHESCQQICGGRDVAAVVQSRLFCHQRCAQVYVHLVW